MCIVLPSRCICDPLCLCVLTTSVVEFIYMYAVCIVVTSTVTMDMETDLVNIITTNGFIDNFYYHYISNLF